MREAVNLDIGRKQAMKLAYSKNRTPVAPDAAVTEILRDVSPESLRALVEILAFPRHYVTEKRANRRARDLLVKQVTSFGYTPILQGSFDNIVMTSLDPADGPFILLGAHYDSAPGTPGADDNASAVAVCLECARLIKKHDIGSVMIVFFNREEDGLLGSSEFVAHLAGQSAWKVKEAHIFEMVGYRDGAAGSQRMPPGLPPLLAPDVGDFLALLANSGSNAIAENLINLAASYVPRFPVIALKIYLGIEKAFGDLNRSDHTPFWQAGIPCVMWTDTSEFRNPHYHLASDTPDTLDYEFMAQVTKLALARTVAGTLD
jgi:Zn-dependent M28 family amino/carboxypeptidase